MTLKRRLRHLGWQGRMGLDMFILFRRCIEDILVSCELRWGGLKGKRIGYLVLGGFNL